MQIYRGLLFLKAMDFAGVLEICEKIDLTGDASREYASGETPDILPLEHRLCLVLRGLAEAGLGDRAAAFKSFAEAERQMERQPVHLDWYWRLLLEWGLANLLLAAGDLAAARTRADRFVNLAELTDERTWRALAWETKARAVLSLGTTTEAVDCVEKALAATKGFETPLADWRVHETAAAAYSMSRNSELAGSHAQLSAAGKKRLAGSLPEGHHLRQTFERSQ